MVLLISLVVATVMSLFVLGGFGAAKRTNAPRVLMIVMVAVVRAPCSKGWSSCAHGDSGGGGGVLLCLFRLLLMVHEFVTSSTKKISKPVVVLARVLIASREDRQLLPASWRAPKPFCLFFGFALLRTVRVQ